MPIAVVQCPLLLKVLDLQFFQIEQKKKESTTDEQIKKSFNGVFDHQNKEFQNTLKDLKRKCFEIQSLNNIRKTCHGVFVDRNATVFARKYSERHMVAAGQCSVRVSQDDLNPDVLSSTSNVLLDLHS